MPVRRSFRPPVLAVAGVLLSLAACGDDDDTPSADEAAEDVDQADDVEDMLDDATDLIGQSSGGDISITIDGETWEFGVVMCGVGEDETGVPGAELHASAIDGTISLYVAAEGDDSYIELADLETMDDGGLNFTTYGGDTPPTISVDGRSFTATADFYSQNQNGGYDGPFEGTVSGSCV